MRLLFVLIMLAVGGYGFWWYSDLNPELRTKVEAYLPMTSVRAFEVKYPASQIIEANQKKLLKEKGSQIVESSLKFYPYLLIESKYTSKNKTKESLLLWDLTDGEMVLDTRDWEKTHGFGDCIRANLLPHEFKIVSTIARKGGSCDRSHLLEKLQVDFPVLEAWMRSCYKKNLVVEAGEKYRLHLQKPKLTRVPETKVDGRLVTKTYKQANTLAKEFSKAQIERVARTAFGQHFIILRATEVYLPVYSVVVQHPKGMLETSHFNALTGKPLNTSLFYE